MSNKNLDIIYHDSYPAFGLEFWIKGSQKTWNVRSGYTYIRTHQTASGSDIAGLCANSKEFARIASKNHNRYVNDVMLYPMKQAYAHDECDHLRFWGRIDPGVFDAGK